MYKGTVNISNKTWHVLICSTTTIYKLEQTTRLDQPDEEERKHGSHVDHNQLDDPIPFIIKYTTCI